MDIERIGRVVEQIAHKMGAAHLVANGWQPTAQNVRKLAYQLAVEQDMLIIVGRVPQAYIEYRADYLRVWINQYIELYRLFSRILFGRGDASFSYGHQNPDTIAMIRGDTTDVMAAIAGFIVPYIASRQQLASPPTDAEIRLVISAVIQELNGEDLSRDRRAQLMQDGTKFIRDLWRQPVRQYALTSFARPVVRDIPPPPQTLPQTGAIVPPQPVEPPPVPPMLPELNMSEEDSKDTGETQRLLRRLLPPMMPLPRTDEEDRPSRVIPPMPLPNRNNGGNK
jgi:hypothetical protein